MVERTSWMKFDPVKVSWNTAWVKSHGHHFEVVVDPDAAIAYRASKGAHPDIRECLRSERVWTDAKRSEHSTEQDLLAAFGTTDALAIGARLILEGELQLTGEYRDRLRDEKRRRILDRIATYAVNPTTGIPHPRTRIELAMDEAKVKIDDNETEEHQVATIVRALQPILPIRLETVTLQVHLPAPWGQKLYGELRRFGTIKRTEYATDGALTAWVDLPAGLQNDLIDDLGKRSHGAADIKRVEERRL